MAKQRAASASCNDVGPVQDLGGRIAPAMLHQEITEFRLEVQPWILAEYLLNDLMWRLIEA